MENIQKLLEAAREILAKYEQEKRSGDYFNCLDICGVGTIENRHTEIIAALLDPQGNHGFGAKPLKAFFQQCDLPEFAKNCDGCSVQTEVKIPGRRPDIVIQGKNLCVIIENKTNTCDHYMQLADYRDWLKRRPSTYKKLLYLTYGGYPASDTHIQAGEYQSISYRETICNWLRDCAGLNETSAADFCRQYAEFIKNTIMTDGIMNNDMTDRILENIDSFKAAACIFSSFDKARFQKLSEVVRECWDGPEAIDADNLTVNIDFPDKTYRIAFQYNGKTPYYGIARKEQRLDYTNFQVDGFDCANDWWIASKYVKRRDFKANWSKADFLAAQWNKDNFQAFKDYIKQCLDEVKNVLDKNQEKIDQYSSET